MPNGTRVNPAEKAKARKSTAPGEEDAPSESGPMILHGSEQAPGAGLTIPGWMKSLGRTISGMGKPKTPGRPATPHPAPPKEMTSAEADSIYKKYVERK